jgi:hypothetical protein|nr:MAG TPA: coiled-coil domain-containing protein [Caudoviricetes sp.]
MTKQEQIEKIAKYVCNVCDFPCNDHKGCPLAEETAEKIYKAGYRKIDDLKAENKQLKTECALLDDELRIARQDTINVLNELKKKYGFYSCYSWNCDVKSLNKIIDEMIKELTK